MYRVRRWLSGPGAHEVTPRALTVMLASGACAPLLLSGQADPGLTVLAASTAAAVGGNMLSGIFTELLERLRGHHGEADVEQQAQEWLEERFTQAVEAAGPGAAALEAQLTLLVDRIGAGHAAVAEAVRLGHEETARQMQAWMSAQVVSRLDELRGTVGGIQQDLQQVLDGLSQPTSVRSRPAGWLLDQVISPFDFALGVHQAIEAANLDVALPELPEYVLRDHDRDLSMRVKAAAEGRSSIAVLVGGSSTGKTRACWEALEPLRGRPEQWRLWHPIAPSYPMAALQELSQIGPRTVIWLNEAQFYLLTGDGTGEQVAAGLQDLLRDPGRGPVLVLATLWPEFWNELTRRPSGGDDPHAQARQLLTDRNITVPPSLTHAEVAAVSAMTDPRLTEAAKAAEKRRVIQFLAGAPELIVRYETAKPAVGALLDAAIDARRLGMGALLPYGFLEAAAPWYLADADRDTLPSNWLETALQDAGEPAKGIRGPLALNRLHSGTAAEPSYHLADYLEQHGRRTRRACFPPDEFWAAAEKHASIDDLPTLATAAENRGLLRNAARLRKRAVRQGNASAAASLVEQCHALDPADLRPAQWTVNHVSVDDPRAVADLLNALREIGTQEQIAAMATRAAVHVSLDDPRAVADLVRALCWTAVDQLAVLATRASDHIPIDSPDAVEDLLHALQESGASEQAAMLATRVARYASLDNLDTVEKLLRVLQESGASEQAAALATRTADHTPIDNPQAVVDLLNVLWHMGAQEQIAAVAARDPASHVPLNNPGAVTQLLYALTYMGAHEQAAVLAARDPASHVLLDRVDSVTRLLNALREAGAHEQIAVLAARDPATHVPLDHIEAITSLLNALGWAGEQEQVAALARRAVGHVRIDDAAAVTELLKTLRWVGALGQAATLTARDPAGHIPLDNARNVSDLLEALQKAGAHEQAATLIARDPAGNVPLDDRHAVNYLLTVLQEAGAHEQAAALVARATDNTPLDDQDAVTNQLFTLRRIGAHEQAAALAARAIDHIPLDDSSAVAKLLSVLREAGAQEQAAALAARVARHAPVENPNSVSIMVGVLREAGAQEHAVALAARAANHAPVNTPYGVGYLLGILLEAGAQEQAAALAARAAEQVPLSPRSAVTQLLNDLRKAGAQEQAAALIARLPVAGEFDLFQEQSDHQTKYRFGRQPGGSPAPKWGWKDLHD